MIKTLISLQLLLPTHYRLPTTPPKHKKTTKLQKNKASLKGIGRHNNRKTNSFFSIHRAAHRCRPPANSWRGPRWRRRLALGGALEEKQRFGGQRPVVCWLLLWISVVSTIYLQATSCLTLVLMGKKPVLVGLNSKREVNKVLGR